MDTAPRTFASVGDFLTRAQVGDSYTDISHHHVATHILRARENTATGPGGAVRVILTTGGWANGRASTVVFEQTIHVSTTPRGQYLLHHGSPGAASYRLPVPAAAVASLGGGLSEAHAFSMGVYAARDCDALLVLS